MSQRFARAALLQVVETESSAFQATVTITTVASDPLVTMVQRGDAQDANAFVSNVVGYVTAGQNSFTWSPPTVTVNSTSAKAVISTTGRPSEQVAIPTAVQLSVAAFSLPGTVEVSTRNRDIVGVSEDGAGGRIASESAHSLTADNLNGELRISLQSGAPQSLSGPPGPTSAHWVARASSTAWGLLSGFAGMLMPACAWIVMFLAGRMGAFGIVGRRVAWRRAERILGAVVIAHLVISACFQLTITEGSLTNSLLSNPSQLQHLSRDMVETGLWSPIGYPAVAGGVVLLIAFALATAGWDARERRGSPRRRFSIAALALVTGAAAVSSYVALAYASPALAFYTVVTYPGGDVQRVASRPALAAELPVVVIANLLVMFLATTWITGSWSAGPASFGGSPGRVATKFPRTRGVIGAGAFGAAAALIGGGIAAAIAYHHSLLSVNPVTL